MAHNLEERNGVVSFAENTLREVAWHNLGTKVEGMMHVDEALKACHADYNVALQPVVALSPEILEIMSNGGSIDSDMLLDLVIKDAKATMRTDYNETLGIVSDKYGIVQNSDAFKFVDTLCSGQLADRNHTPTIECCGVLGKGERVFVTAKFPEQVVLDAKRDDLLNMYVVFTTSHDGSGAVRAMVTPVRVVCNNTLQLAMQNNIGRISFRHTSNVMNRLDLTKEENAQFAYKTLNVYETYTKSLKEQFDHLRNIRLSEKQLDNILAEVLLPADAYKVYQAVGNVEGEGISTRSKNVFYGVKNALECGIGQDIQEKGTGLWAINGITTYYQNNANFKNEEAKMDSITEGAIYNKVNKAYDLILTA